MVSFTHDHWHPCWHSVICKNHSRSFTTFAFLLLFLFWLCFLFSIFLLLWTFPLFRAFFLLAVFLAFLLLWLLTKRVNSDSFSYYWYSTRTQLLKKTEWAKESEFVPIWQSQCMLALWATRSQCAVRPEINLSTQNVFLACFPGASSTLTAACPTPFGTTLYFTRIRAWA